MVGVSDMRIQVVSLFSRLPPGISQWKKMQLFRIFCSLMQQTFMQQNLHNSYSFSGKKRASFFLQFFCIFIKYFSAVFCILYAVFLYHWNVEKMQKHCGKITKILYKNCRKTVRGKKKLACFLQKNCRNYVGFVS